MKKDIIIRVGRSMETVSKHDHVIFSILSENWRDLVHIRVFFTIYDWFRHFNMYHIKCESKWWVFVNMAAIFQNGYQIKSKYNEQSFYLLNLAWDCVAMKWVLVPLGIKCYHAIYFSITDIIISAANFKTIDIKSFIWHVYIHVIIIWWSML